MASSTRADSLTSDGIIRSYLVLSGLYTLSTSIIWGVNTLFLLDAGLTVFQVFLANAIFTGSMALFEIPTGVLADTRGRRLSFLLSILVLLIGTLGYVTAAEIGGGLVLVSAMSVILGLGYTFYSGATEAWLVDALTARGFHGRLDQVFARSATLSGFAMLVGTVGGGLLGTLDLSIPYLVRAGLLAAVLITAFWRMYDIGFSPAPIPRRALPAAMRRLAVSSIAYGWQVRPVRLLILASAAQAAVLGWGFYAWQPYFLELLGLNAPWVAGIIAALVALAGVAGNTLVEPARRIFHRRTSLLLAAGAVMTLATVVVGLAGNFWWAVAAYLVGSVAFGAIGPVRQAFIHQLIPSEQRATVISFDSLVSNGAGVGGQAGLGYVAQTYSFGAGYVISGLIIGLMLPAYVALRRRNAAPDVIPPD